PEEAEVAGNRIAGWTGHEPEVDPPGVRRDLRVGLDRAARCDRGTHQLLAEPVEARSRPGRCREHGQARIRRRRRERHPARERTTRACWCRAGWATSASD